MQSKRKSGRMSGQNVDFNYDTRAVDYCNDGLKIPQSFKPYICEFEYILNFFKTKYFQTPRNRFPTLSGWF